MFLSFEGRRGQQYFVHLHAKRGRLSFLEVQKAKPDGDDLLFLVGNSCVLFFLGAYIDIILYVSTIGEVSHSQETSEICGYRGLGLV